MQFPGNLRSTALVTGAATLLIGSAFALSKATTSSSPQEAKVDRSPAKEKTEPAGFDADFLISRKGPKIAPGDLVQVKRSKIRNTFGTFNGVPSSARAELRSVTVSGIELVFDPTDDASVLNEFDGSKPGADDLAEITLIADRVVIRAGWEMPGAEVTVKARQLIFDGDGALINTSPKGFKAPAANYRNDSKGKNIATGSNGYSGQSAGDIHLHCLEVDLGPSLHSETFRFIMNGSRGQDPGKGRSGKAGSPSTGKVWRYKGKGKTKGKSYTNVLHVHYQGLYELDRLAGTVKNVGSRITPTNGEKAVAGGQPGNGGDGGNLYSMYALSEPAVVQQLPGGAGKATPSYRGGRSGYPHGTWNWMINDGFNVWVHKSKTPTAGASSQRKSGRIGAAGTMAGLEEGEGVWPLPEVVLAQYELVRSHFLNGHTESAKENAVSYLRLAQVNQEHLDGLDADPRTRRAHDGLITLARRIMYDLDYFGKPQGWAPMLSLETLFQTYEGRIDNAVKLLFLTHRLEQHWNDSESKLANLESLLEAKDDEAQYYVQAHDRAEVLLKRLSTDLAQIKRESDDLTQELGVVERRFSERYRDKQEMLDYARATLGALKQAGEMYAFLKMGSGGTGAGKAAIGIGAAGLIDGVIAEKAMAGSNQGVTDALNQLNSDEDMLAARERLSLLSVGDADDQEAFTASLKEISATLKDTLKVQLLEAAMGDYPEMREANLEKLKSDDPKFSDVLDRCVEMTMRKQVFALKAAEAHAMMEGCVQALNQSMAEMSELNEAIKDHTIDEILRDTLRSVRTRAEERLMECKYYMVKAYEYRMLHACPASFQSNRLFTQIEKIAERADLEMDAALYDSLASIYRDDLEEIKQRIVKEFSEYRGDAIVVNEPLELSASELAQLNATGAVEIDLGSRILFPNEQGCRLESITVDTRTTRFLAASGGIRSGAEIFVEPGRSSVFKWRDQKFAFNYGQESSFSLGGWGFRWDSNRPSEFRSFQTGTASSELMEAVGNTKHANKVQFRPGVRTKLTIRKTDRNPAEQTTVEKLEFVVRFSKYQARKS